MNTHTILDFFHHHLTNLEKLLDGVPDERWAEQPGGLRNHPAWTVGHLALGMQFGLAMMGQEPYCPDYWRPKMGIGSIPVANRDAYPDRDTLMKTYRKGHALLTLEIKEAKPEIFTAINPIEPARTYFPTIGHGILYVTTLHDAHHQAQLIQWKRAAGLVAD